MTSNSLTSLIVVAVLATAVGAQPMEQETIFAVAKVAGKTKEIDGWTHQLLAIHRDARVYAYVSGMTDVFWVFNGKFNGDLVKDSTLFGTSDSLPGKVDIWVALFWVRLPDKGELEFVFGAARLMPGEKMDIVPGRLVQAGYKPFKVDVKDLPEVAAGTAEEVSARVLKLGKGPKSPGGK